MSGRRAPLEQRFERKLPLDRQPDSCWLWRGSPNAEGYGRLREGGQGSRVYLAHRLAYELAVGPIPDGLTIDHRCHTESDDCAGGPGCAHRRCVNPAHLEPVTNSENVKRGNARTIVAARQNRCMRGHSLENAYVVPRTGSRQCRVCRDIRKAAA